MIDKGGTCLGSCRSQHERVAVESLLSISQCSPGKVLGKRRTTARWSSDGPLTPPHSDDELYDINSCFSQPEIARKHSKLAQVCSDSSREIKDFFVIVSTIGQT